MARKKKAAVGSSSRKTPAAHSKKGAGHCGKMRTKGQRNKAM